MSTTPNQPENLKMPDVLARLTISRTTLHELRTKGDFPKPLKLSARRIAWRLADIEAWEASR